MHNQKHWIKIRNKNLTHRKFDQIKDSKEKNKSEISNENKKDDHKKDKENLELQLEDILTKIIEKSKNADMNTSPNNESRKNKNDVQGK